MMLLCLLVKHDCKHFRNDAFGGGKNAVIIELDYDEAPKREFDVKIKSG